MRKGFIRQLSAFFLMFAFLLSATAIAPLSVAAQTTDEKSKVKKDKKDKSKTEKQTTPIDGKKALAQNEDPNLIGKRNINSGGDKFWGWLGGSKEKEIQVG